MARRQARQQAVRWLYEQDVGGTALDELIGRTVQGIRPEDARYAKELIRGVDAHRGELDEWLGHLSHDWRVERMAAVDRAVLRLGLYELRYARDVPAPVVLSEAVELTGMFSTPQAKRFVNGVLSQASREVHDPVADSP
jgi:N utilization substance protein B